MGERIFPKGTLRGATNPYDTRIRYRSEKQRELKTATNFTADHCLCGGLLAETDHGIVWCLTCEPMPAEVVHGGRMRG